jgi:DNA-binding response OmpR family regulator
VTFVARGSVLIVDDDSGMSETLADIFTAKGYDAGTASSGQAALDLADRTPYDLVIMDIQMPGLNGLQTLRALRAKIPGIPAIMMTAFTRDESVEEAHRASVLAVLPKPLDLDEVFVLARDATCPRGGHRSA